MGDVWKEGPDHSAFREVALPPWFAALADRLSVVSEAFVVLLEISMSRPLRQEPVENGAWEFELRGGGRGPESPPPFVALRGLAEPNPLPYLRNFFLGPSSVVCDRGPVLWRGGEGRALFGQTVGLFVAHDVLVSWDTRDEGPARRDVLC